MKPSGQLLDASTSAFPLAPTGAPRHQIAVEPGNYEEMIVDYDARFAPARREAFLREWLKEQETRQSIALLHGAGISGYGTIRACREGFKIGPLFSDTDVGAELIFRALVASVGGGEVFLDIPAPNAEAKALCVRHGLSPVFETARMYRGAAPDLPLGHIYGITTFELG